MDKIMVETPVGILVIEAKGSVNDYPGIYVGMLSGEAVATVEYTPNRNADGTPGIQILAWEDASAEEASVAVNVDNVDAWN